MAHSALLAPHVRSFFEDHLVCQRNMSPNTIQSYRDALKLFLRFSVERLNKAATKLLVTDIQEPLVIGFLTELEQTRGNSIQTRNHRLSALQNLYEYIASRDPALLDHCHRIVAIPRKRGAALPEIHYLEKEQVNAILGAAGRNTAISRRDYALLLFLYNTGARVQEAADTRVSWLTLTSPYKVELLGKGRKWRSCPLWENTVQQLRQLIEERRLTAGQDVCLFVNRQGSQLSRSGIADIIERHVAKAAETTGSLRGRRVTPHTFRHTTAMHLLQSGVEINVIRSWLGHVSLATTNQYIEIDLAMKAKALETCEVGRSEPPAALWRSEPDILAWLESLCCYAEGTDARSTGKNGFVRGTPHNLQLDIAPIMRIFTLSGRSWRADCVPGRATPG
jgi:site-specific recombinase XerD